RRRSRRRSRVGSFPKRLLLFLRLRVGIGNRRRFSFRNSLGGGSRRRRLCHRSRWSWHSFHGSRGLDGCRRRPLASRRYGLWPRRWSWLYFFRRLLRDRLGGPNRRRALPRRAGDRRRS